MNSSPNVIFLWSLALLVLTANAALCGNWKAEDKCNGANDGGCTCYWKDKACWKDASKCSGMGITSVDEKQLGETCGACLNENGDCGSCTAALSCQCLEDCANPAIADQEKTCVANKCPCGSMCVMEDGKATGICLADDTTCSASNVSYCEGVVSAHAGPNAACVLSDGKGHVASGWGGNDVGNNSCNGCRCDDGVLTCTLRVCDTNKQRGECLRDGRKFVDGWSGLLVDDCNLCKCSGGSIVCTEKACTPVLSTSNHLTISIGSLVATLAIISTYI